MTYLETPEELKKPIVSSLKDGETLDLVRMISGKNEHSERLIYKNVMGFFICTRINYFGHKETNVVFDLGIADYEVNGLMYFNGWEINKQKDKFLIEV